MNAHPQGPKTSTGIVPNSTLKWQEMPIATQKNCIESYTVLCFDGQWLNPRVYLFCFKVFYKFTLATRTHTHKNNLREFYHVLSPSSILTSFWSPENLPIFFLAFPEHLWSTQVVQQHEQLAAKAIHNRLCHLTALHQILGKATRALPIQAGHGSMEQLNDFLVLKEQRERPSVARKNRETKTQSRDRSRIRKHCILLIQFWGASVTFHNKKGCPDSASTAEISSVPLGNASLNPSRRLLAICRCSCKRPANLEP